MWEIDGSTALKRRLLIFSEGVSGSSVDPGMRSFTAAPDFSSLSQKRPLDPQQRRIAVGVFVLPDYSRPARGKAASIQKHSKVSA
jgi:hypothetical protein